MLMIQPWLGKSELKAVPVCEPAGFPEEVGLLPAAHEVILAYSGSANKPAAAISNCRLHGAGAFFLHIQGEVHLAWAWKREYGLHVFEQICVVDVGEISFELRYVVVSSGFLLHFPKHHSLVGLLEALHSHCIDRAYFYGN